MAHRLASAGLWIVPLAAGHQWVGILNSGVSMTICARNYAASRAAPEPAVSRITVYRSARLREERHDVTA